MTRKPEGRDAQHDHGGRACGGDVHVLVVGQRQGRHDAAAQVAGVTQVLLAEGDSLAHGLADGVAAQVLAVVGNAAGG